MTTTPTKVLRELSMRAGNLFPGVKRSGSYSDEWIERFIAHRNGVAIVNTRPETTWFQHLCMKAEACLWLRGRVKFIHPNGSQGPSTCGSVLVAYGRNNGRALAESKLPGIIMTVGYRFPASADQFQITNPKSKMHP